MITLKRIITAIILLLSLNFCKAQETNEYIGSKGDWEDEKSWSLSHAPKSGEIIIIPSSATVMINESLDLQKIELLCSGVLILNNAYLQLDEESVMEITEKACIESANNSEGELMIIGKSLKFSGAKEGKRCGYGKASQYSGESPEGFSGKEERSVNSFNGKSEQWTTEENWSLGRIPRDGDSVIIPNKSSVVLTKDQQIEDIYLEVRGSLILEKAFLVLGKSSTVLISKSGRLSSQNADESERIIVGDVDKFNGAKDNTLTGFSIANSATGTSPLGFSGDAVLPVLLKKVTASIIRNAVVVRWETEGEGKPVTFYIEESPDGMFWHETGMVGEHAEKSNIYSFTRNGPVIDRIFIRLLMVDIDHQITYSKVIRLNSSVLPFKTTVSAAGNNTLHIRVEGDYKKKMYARIFSADGKILFSSYIVMGTTVLHSLWLNASRKQLSVLEIKDEDGRSFTKSFINN